VIRYYVSREDAEDTQGSRADDLVGRLGFTALPILPGRRAAFVGSKSDGSTITFVIDYLLGNLRISTAVTGAGAWLTEARAFGIAEISLTKYDHRLRQRTTFWSGEHQRLDLQALVYPLVRVFVPLIGLTLMLLFFPTVERDRATFGRPRLAGVIL